MTTRTEEITLADFELKGAFPYRLGTTSFIRPADMITNVRLLATVVDDVELLIFESDEISPLPTAAEVVAIRETALAHDLSVTVHLPLDLSFDSRATCDVSVDKCRRVMDHLVGTAPVAWILHLPGRDGSAPAETMAARALATLTAHVDDARCLCVETLDYDLKRLNAVIVDADCGVCVDVGHLIMAGFDPQTELNAWRDRVGVLHFHGVGESGRDHAALTVGNRERTLSVLEQAATLPSLRVMTVEVFNETKLVESLTFIQEWRQSTCRK